MHIADSFTSMELFRRVPGFSRRSRLASPKTGLGHRLCREMFVEGCDILLAEADMPDDKRISCVDAAELAADGLTRRAKAGW